MRIVSIVGARPQFVKASAISRRIAEYPGLDEILIHTGQHYDRRLADIFFQELEIPDPAYNLGVGSGSHGVQTGTMLAKIEEVLLVEKPDWALVYGDTNSTLAGALAAVKLHIPVAHVEAGVRSFNRRMPEEINRVLTDHASDVLLAPTAAAVTNLRHEGIPETRIHLTGDVMYDAAHHFAVVATDRSRILDELKLQHKHYVLVTVHRAENTDDPQRLEAIFRALQAMADEVQIVLPLHPRTRKALDRLCLLERLGQRLRIVEPLGYLDMIMLVKSARLIATDSGGLQKEAYFSKVPCVTLRDETEWVELLGSGWNTVLPPLANLTERLKAALDSPAPQAWSPIYGNGRAGEEIARILVEHGPESSCV